MSDKIPPLCDQPKWNHIRHRCCCVFDHDSDKNEPLAECYYHERIRARLAEAEAAAKVWENEAERRARRYEKAEAENTRLRQEVNVYRESLGKQPLDDERPWEMRTDSATQRETAP